MSVQSGKYGDKVAYEKSFLDLKKLEKEVEEEEKSKKNRRLGDGDNWVYICQFKHEKNQIQSANRDNNYASEVCNKTRKFRYGYRMYC